MKLSDLALKQQLLSTEPVLSVEPEVNTYPSGVVTSIPQGVSVGGEEKAIKWQQLQFDLFGVSPSSSVITLVEAKGTRSHSWLEPDFYVHSWKSLELFPQHD